MRIAIVVRSLKIGGMERVALSLAEAFASNNHESHLIYFKQKKNVLTPGSNIHLHHFNLDKLMYLTIFGFFYEIFFRLFNMILRKSYPLFKGFFTSQLFKLKMYLLEKRYGDFDLIIVRGQGTLEMMYQNNDSKIIAVSENIFSYGTMNKFISNLQIKALYKNRNIVGVSTGVAENFKKLEIAENFKAKKIIKITNPIDIDNTNNAAKQYKPDFNFPYILSVGRVVPAKNISLLIEAYAYAKEQYNLKHHLVIVGDGSDMKNITKKVHELSLTQYVHFIGSLTNPFPWILVADLFVLSSKFEGLGMVVLEALACHTKVVATRSEGGVVDIMKNDLEVFLSDISVKELAKKIIYTLNSDITIDYEKHLKDFFPETIVTEYINTFTLNTIS